MLFPVCLVHAVPRVARRGHQIPPQDWTLDRCCLLYRYWGLNPSLLEEQPGFLTVEPSLQLLYFIVKKKKSLSVVSFSNPNVKHVLYSILPPLCIVSFSSSLLSSFFSIPSLLSHLKLIRLTLKEKKKNISYNFPHREAQFFSIAVNTSLPASLCICCWC